MAVRLINGIIQFKNPTHGPAISIDPYIGLFNSTALPNPQYCNTIKSKDIFYGYSTVEKLIGYSMQTKFMINGNDNEWKNMNMSAVQHK